ncbi:Nuclear pore assembly and biogenesis protein APQ12 [Penicillium cinerascens]|uniref:Nuclear pore assembly and biogenesis protein APQ12 n=1 Tax=Penicillium cinerascens TaxID=70096 RepID=A0A9W9NER3_9EURO|nr:Nuclear pore assembly and biogenesis protein APQ12 [Penicillium cinerascens]KAJ5218545.1 Nuclear pore assembly and biogenesis protein APQ12 [Penicillium cinerascens]
MDMLPENLQTLLTHPTVTYITTKTQDQVTTHLSNLRETYIQPYIITPLSTLLTSSTTSAMPDLVQLLILAIILFISLKVLDYARRVIMFWVMLAFRLVFWGSLLGMGLYVYRVGVENAGRDLGWLWGVVQGFVEDFQARATNNGSESGWNGAGAKKGYSRW